MSQAIPPETRSDSCQTPSDSWQSAWENALDEMELDLAQAEELLDAVHRGAQLPPAARLLGLRWSAPSNLGPLPDPLLARAQQLLLRQGKVADDLAHTASGVRRHASATSAITDHRPPAVFVDVAM